MELTDDKPPLKKDDSDTDQRTIDNDRKHSVVFPYLWESNNLFYSPHRGVRACLVKRLR